MGSKKILVIAPHADDEVLGCGGIINKYSRQGHEIHVLLATNASNGAPELYNQHSIDKVRKEALKAHKILDVFQTHFLELPAPRLDTYPIYLIANQFSELINKVNPQLLLLPHRGDIHKDHAAIFNAGLVAARPINNCPIKKILAYETLSETEWAAPFGDDYFIPNVYVCIEGSIEKKLEAMSQFKSQLKDFPHPRSLKALRSLAELRGSTIGCKVAEAFMLIRDIEK